MTKQKTLNILYWLCWIWIIIVAYSVWYFNKTDTSELNKKIDIQEWLIRNHCWVCYQAKKDLQLLYTEKSESMSGFIKEWLSQ